MGLLDSFLSLPAVSRVRRNHGLEHATLNILAEQNPRLHLAGHSDVAGFWVVGDVPTEAVAEAVGLALERMKAGEQELAIHANCGTNFVTAGAAAGIAAWLVMLTSGRSLRQKIERLPMVISLATVAIIIAQPLGLILQARVTTSGKPGNLRVIQISAGQQGHFLAHRVVTQG
jgi:hypothetical protein